MDSQTTYEEFNQMISFVNYCWFGLLVIPIVLLYWIGNTLKVMREDLRRTEKLVTEKLQFVETVLMQWDDVIRSPKFRQ